MSLWSTLQCALRTDRLDREGRWSQSRRHRLAERRLRRPVRFAVAKSPCYRRLYAGLDPNRVRLKDLPPVTKELLRANLDDVLTDRAVAQTDLVAVVADTASFGTWYLGRYAVSHTSGSPGPPLLIVQDRRAIRILFSLMSARANAGTWLRSPADAEAGCRESRGSRDVRRRPSGSRILLAGSGLCLGCCSTTPSTRSRASASGGPRRQPSIVLGSSCSFYAELAVTSTCRRWSRDSVVADCPRA